jgi:O-antigen/teichoic acid export membrane protein
MSASNEVLSPPQDGSGPAAPHRLVVQTARGGLVTFAGQACRIGINFVATVCLARLLSPADYGLFGMATVLTGFAAMFADLGLNQAALQREQISQEQQSALFWLNALVGLGFTLLGLLLSPLAGWFYGEKVVTRVVALLATTFVISALGGQHLTVLRREMRFRRIVVTDVCSMLGAVIAAIACAKPLGVWALVVQQLANACFTTLGYWLGSKWRPSFPKRAADMRNMLHFGAQVTGFRLVNYLARNFDNLLLGRVHGAVVLGLYSRAYSLFVLPLSNINAPIGAAVIPGMSRAQNEPAVFREIYLGALRVVVWMSIPLSTALIAVADPLIPTLLGHKWGDVIPIFRLLGICGFGQAIGNTMGWVYVARGDGARMLRWGVFASTAVVVSFIVGVPFGAEGVALAYSVTTCLLVPIGIRQALKGSPISEKDVYRLLAKPLLLSASVGLAAFAACHWLVGVYLQLGVSFGIYLVTVALLLRSPEARQMLRSLRERLAKR